MSDFQNVFNNGYYFDRCIDLEFYNAKGELLAVLETPKKGMKPSITVKGTFIEGSYAISSYVSIQNLAYDVNVNSIATIKCTMYWSGLKDAIGGGDELNKIKNGNSILFSVLYADQEKEPPNRAVRFQCTVASFDWMESNANIDITNGKVKFLKESATPKEKTGNGKKSSGTTELITFLKDVAKAYNENIDEQDKKSVGKNSLKKGDSLKIWAVEYPDVLKGATITPENGVKTIGELLKDWNKAEIAGVKGFNGSAKTGGTYKICIVRGILMVSIIPPSNWTDQFIKAGGSVETLEQDYIEKVYKKVTREKIGTTTVSKTSYDNKTPIPLNYVKSAYRNEINVTVSTLFDGRVYPGCYCVLEGNAIMGKHAAKSGRLHQLTGKKVMFRATGAIEFEFSTTEQATMTMTGPVVEEDWRK